MKMYVVSAHYKHLGEVLLMGFQGDIRKLSIVFGLKKVPYLEMFTEILAATLSIVQYKLINSTTYLE